MTQWIDYRTSRPFNFPRDRHRPLGGESRFTLPDEERRGLLDGALDHIGDPYQTDEREEFIQYAHKTARATVSTDSRKQVRAALEDGFGAVLLDNLPTDPELPPTPTTGGSLPRAYKKTYVSEFVLAALGTLVDAEVFNFRQEGRGSAPVFDNVVPIPSMADQRGAGGFKNNFPFHCESAWHRMRPDYLALVGVREDSGARTLVTSVTDLAEHDLMDALPQDAYRLKPPDLYVQMESNGMPSGTPVFSMRPPVQRGAAPSINVNFNGTDCRGGAAVRWLAGLENLVEANASGCVLGPGQALLLNNFRVCHTRTGYVPRFGPDARWFVRGYFKRDLWNGGRHPHEHLSATDVRTLEEYGWLTASGRLTTRFQQFVDDPARLGDLPDAVRPLAEKAFHLTPIAGSRVV